MLLSPRLLKIWSEETNVSLVLLSPKFLKSPNHTLMDESVPNSWSHVLRNADEDMRKDLRDTLQGSIRILIIILQTEVSNSRPLNLNCKIQKRFSQNVQSSNSLKDEMNPKVFLEKILRISSILKIQGKEYINLKFWGWKRN